MQTFCVDPAAKIKLARKYHPPALTQKELSERAGVDRSSLGRYETGGPIPRQQLQKLARALSLPVSWFVSGDDSLPPFHGVELVDNLSKFGAARSQDLRSMSTSVGLPLWSGVVAGYGEECHFSEEPEPRLQEVPLLLIGEHPPEVCRVFKVAGSSMSPRVEHSQLGLVVLNPDAPINTLVMARRGDGALFVKALRPGKAPMPYELHSVNSAAFPPIVDVEDWQIVGSVIAFLAPPTAGDRNIEWNFGLPLRA